MCEAVGKALERDQKEAGLGSAASATARTHRFPTFSDVHHHCARWRVLSDLSCPMPALLPFASIGVIQSRRDRGFSWMGTHSSGPRVCAVHLFSPTHTSPVVSTSLCSGPRLN